MIWLVVGNKGKKENQCQACQDGDESDGKAHRKGAVIIVAR